MYPLRVLGRPPLRVRLADFLRPASTRLERGRLDPDGWYGDGHDLAGLAREVLAPLGPGGSGRYLPALWDADRDRASRRVPVPAPPGAVLLVDGVLLADPHVRWGFDVHVWVEVSDAAVLRRARARGAGAEEIAELELRELPGVARYRAEVDPAAVADAVVRAEDQAHPALLLRLSG